MLGLVGMWSVVCCGWLRPRARGARFPRSMKPRRACGGCVQFLMEKIRLPCVGLMFGLVGVRCVRFW